MELESNHLAVHSCEERDEQQTEKLNLKMLDFDTYMQII